MGASSQSAWVPLTPRGVAAFAPATTRRLLLVQTVFALAVSAGVAWFLYWDYFPVVSKALEQLPTEGEIRSARLDWRGPSTQMLAEGRFLAFTVDLDHTGGLRSAAHVQVEFGKESFRIRSLLGAMDRRYPTGWVIAFNRTELKPLWGAWQPAVLAGVLGGTVAGLLLCWNLLALLYSPLAMATGFFANRDLDLVRSWRLAGAAWMPGALVMSAAIVAYGLAFIDLVALMFAFGVHFVVGWVYLFLSLLFVPSRSGTAARKNPFSAPADKQVR